jgi:hypothetical protein
VLPALKKLRFHLSLWLWARLLPAMTWGRDLKSLLDLASPSQAPSSYRGLATGYIVRRVKRVCRRPWLMRSRPCLREGLLAYRFLTLAGHAPVLRFGVEKGGTASSDVSAHCWVDVGRETVLNPPPAGMIGILCVDGGACSGRGG